MRTLRYLLAIALACGLNGVARADDFQMVVVDPNPPANLITQIYSDNFSVTLSTCQASQLFGLSAGTYIGCFTGENLTGQTLTSLQIIIPVFNFNNQLDQPGCAAVSQDIFTHITCGFTNNNQDYFVDLSGGNIPAATGLHGDCDHDGDGGAGLNADDVACNVESIFTIAEAGIPARDFPSFDVQANVVTPEPSSIWLMSTGVLSIGLYGAFRRRQAVCESRS